MEFDKLEDWKRFVSNIVFDKRSTPFEHFIVKDILRTEILEEALSKWPDESSPNCDSYRNNKWAISDDLGVIDEVFWEVIVRLISPPFLRRLEQVAGIPKLLGDIELNGAGLHEVRSGGKLDMHVDFNRLGNLYRRLNLLVYLNPTWD
jgi:hypothetical protein